MKGSRCRDRGCVTGDTWWRWKGWGTSDLLKLWESPPLPNPGSPGFPQVHQALRLRVLTGRDWCWGGAESNKLADIWDGQVWRGWSGKAFCSWDLKSENNPARIWWKSILGRGDRGHGQSKKAWAFPRKKEEGGWCSCTRSESQESWQEASA